MPEIIAPSPRARSTAKKTDCAARATARTTGRSPASGIVAEGPGSSSPAASTGVEEESGCGSSLGRRRSGWMSSVSGMFSRMRLRNKSMCGERSCARRSPSSSSLKALLGQGQ